MHIGITIRFKTHNVEVILIAQEGEAVYNIFIMESEDNDFGRVS